METIAKVEEVRKLLAQIRESAAGLEDSPLAPPDAKATLDEIWARVDDFLEAINLVAVLVMLREETSLLKAGAVEV